MARHRKPVIEGIPRPLTAVYEKACRLVVESTYGPMAGRITAHMPTGVILDLGTGPGYLPIEMAKSAPKIRVVGVDLNLGLIRRARRNARHAGVSDRVRFETGHAAGLRFADRSFDMVCSTGMLHMVKDPAAVLRECCRVLKPGGEAWIFDPAQVASGVDRDRYLASLTPVEKLIFRCFPLYTRINPPNRYDRRQIDAMVTATAFHMVQLSMAGREIEMILRKE